MKKAQLSINTVVITIIALAVLITLVLFFTGKFATFSEGVSEFDQQDTTSDAGCQVACNLERSGAGKPYTNKFCVEQCLPPAFTCEGISPVASDCA
jgi:hypothetical protein